MNFLTQVKAFTALALITAIVPSIAFGHFIWVAKTGTDGAVKVFFGEGPFPDQAMFLDGLKDLKVWSIDADGTATAIKFAKKTEGSEGWFECESSEKLNRVDARCEYGVFGRGDKTMFLDYSAKFCEFAPGLETTHNPQLPLDIAVKAGKDAVEFVVMHKGKPAADCEFRIVDADDNAHELKTDDKGFVKFASVPKGKWLVRAKTAEEKSGERNGQAYSEKRYYCTLVLNAPATVTSAPMKKVSTEKAAEPAKVSRTTPYAELPVGITSFGGAVAGDSLYVFGGHCGDAHDYYKSGQNGKLYRLNLKSPTQWETVHEGLGLQGLAMVEHKGILYRVGGFEARNKQGDEQDLHSVTDFAKFNMETRSWEKLQPMPTPRSSLDAVVVGDKLFVFGGWIMAGNEDKKWHENAVWIDLAKTDSKWQTIDVPFHRRAMSIGYRGDNLYVVGGMRSKGGPTSEVNVYNIESGEWSKGPKLPGSNSMAGFGSSCFNVGGKLVVSTYNGDVIRLSDDGSSWEKLHQMETGRFFHRLLPLSEEKFLLVGGANMSIGKILDIPVFEFN